MKAGSRSSSNGAQLCDVRCRTNTEQTMSLFPKSLISNCVHAAQGHFKPLLPPCPANPFHKPRTGTVSVLSRLKPSQKSHPRLGMNDTIHSSIAWLCSSWYSAAFLCLVASLGRQWHELIFTKGSVQWWRWNCLSNGKVLSQRCFLCYWLWPTNLECLLHACLGKNIWQNPKNREGTYLPTAKSEKKKKKKVNKGWIWQRVVSWTNGSSHTPNNVKAWGFQRCLAALEDVTPNFIQHLIYLRSFENPAFHNPAPAQSFLAVLKHALCVDSSPAINHIPQALETTSPVGWASTVPCNEFHHSEFLSSWNQLMLFFFPH